MTCLKLECTATRQVSILATIFTGIGLNVIEDITACEEKRVLDRFWKTEFA